MNYELTGVIEKIFDTQQVTDKFVKKEFVIETEGNYSELIKFQLTRDNCDLIDPYAEGEEIKVHFNLKGRKWDKDGKTAYFTNLEAWRIEKIKADVQEPVDDVPEEDDLPY